MRWVLLAGAMAFAFSGLLTLLKAIDRGADGPLLLQLSLVSFLALFVCLGLSKSVELLQEIRDKLDHRA